MMRVGQDCETGDCSLHPQTCVWLFLSNKRTLVEGEGKNTLQQNYAVSAKSGFCVVKANIVGKQLNIC